MRDQYAGDVSDYLKLAFLRQVAPGAGRLGVAWYYLPGHDGRADGRHLEYLAQPAWRALDPPLHDALAKLPDRSVASLERLAAWQPGTIFHKDPVPPRRDRAQWASTMVEALSGCDAAFLDPDNGLSRAGAWSRKSATREELEAVSRDGRLTFLIRFPHRMTPHATQLSQLHSELLHLRPMTVRTCVRVPSVNGGGAPRIRWLTALNGDREVGARMLSFAERLASIPGARAETHVAGALAYPLDGLNLGHRDH